MVSAASAGYAHLSDGARARGFTERLRPLILASRVEAIMQLAWPPTTVIHDDATRAAIAPADRMVIDPPYQGTCGYGDELTREHVCKLAQAYAEAGATVGVCEAEPLGGTGPLPGWTSTRLRRAGSMQRTAPVDEWLTTSAAPSRPQTEMPW